MTIRDAPDVLSDGYYLTDADINLVGVPHDQFTALRKASPILWIEQTETARAGMAGEAGSGYWAVTKHADVAAVSRNNRVFSSRENGALIRNPESVTRESLELQRRQPS